MAKSRPRAIDLDRRGQARGDSSHLSRGTSGYDQGQNQIETGGEYDRSPQIVASAPPMGVDMAAIPEGSLRILSMVILPLAWPILPATQPYHSPIQGEQKPLT